METQRKAEVSGRAAHREAVEDDGCEEREQAVAADEEERDEIDQRHVKIPAGVDGSLGVQQRRDPVC